MVIKKSIYYPLLMKTFVHIKIPSSLERNYLYIIWTMKEKTTFLRSSPRKHCVTIVCTKKKSVE